MAGHCAASIVRDLAKTHWERVAFDQDMPVRIVVRPVHE
jgi:hypothetical protein